MPGITFGTPPFNPGSSSSGGFDWGSLISGGLGLVSSIIGANASGKAANAQITAAQQGLAQSLALTKSIYDQNRADSMPWLKAGGASVNKLAFLLGLPGYKNPSSTTTAATPAANRFANAGSTNTFVPRPNTISLGGDGYEPSDFQDAVGARHDIGMGPYNAVAGDTRPASFGPKPRFSWLGAGGRPNELGGDTGAPVDDGMGDPSQFGSLDRDFSLSDFYADPGYEFRLAEGEKALERSAAARGGALGGRTLKELSRYNQGFASNEYGNVFNRFNVNRTDRYNRYSNLAGLGQTAANTIANSGNNYASNGSSLIYGGNTDIGNARASGYIGSANAVNNGISGIRDLLLLRNLGKI